MEQQTISVAKAGITTTLNARTSILAAANPARSRYNPRLTPEENINLPAALLSRFDVLFLMLDRPNHDDDLRMARHVAFVHTHGRHPRAGELDAVDAQDGHQDDHQDGVGEIDMELLRLFVADARARTPTVPRNVADYVVGAYVQLRQQHKQSQQLATASASRGAIDTGMGGSSSKSSIGNTTPRTLLGILRLAQARARVRGQDVVGVEDVDEALRLMDAAQVTLDAQPSAGMRAGLFGERTARTDPVSAIFQIVARMARQQTGVAGGVPELRYSEVLERVRAAGFNETGLAQCLRQYEEINVLQVNLAQTKITFVAAVNE
ncbi:DNA replication licensing factor MCM7 [Linderina macrospora]|uniref:DNA replication licensing factor MCM7 n=1 Tax=Linderina macrospora TaxID=4868 RepID=A0ACC1JD61_9FUNG|nr:DNA replication licensing factor MCM7 [Linderina macrospora]